MFRQMLDYSKSEWDKLFAFVPAGGFKAFISKILMFVWIWFCSYSAYFLIPLAIGMADCYYDMRANVAQGEKRDWIRFFKGLINKAFSFMALLLMIFAIEYLVKKDIHYDGNYLLMTIAFIISSHEVGGVCASLSVVHPSWKFVQQISHLLGVAQKKIIDKAENIIK